MPSRGAIDSPKLPEFLPDTAGIRESDWACAAVSDFDLRNAVRLTGIESYAEARQWADAIRENDDKGTRRPGAIHVVVVIDTVFAAFEIEEILYELRDFGVAVQLSPWGYLFSYIKVFSKHPEYVLPDRSDITMSTHCLRSYAQHVFAICQSRKAVYLQHSDDHDESIGEAHVRIEAADLLQVPRGRITETGVRENLRLVLRYLAGDASADVTDVEFARAQLWQWLHLETGVLDSGRIITATLFDEWLSGEQRRLVQSIADHGLTASDLEQAARVLGDVTKADTIAAFLPREVYHSDE